jgi:uncharacterized protein (TIGR01440 family)
MLSDIIEAARKAAVELCDKAMLIPGQTVIIGCSTSEIKGYHVGSNSSIEIGEAVLNAMQSVFSGRGVYLAAQCCEHLNRAVVVERIASSGYEIVNAVPAPDAGGAFAAAAYSRFEDPVTICSIRADAGIDIGNTLIGMHLKKVAVPLRLDTVLIGKAPVVAARTRPPLIGGVRAGYDDRMM